MHVERFAPSPTGPLHLGHAFSAMTAAEQARALGGRFLLRIEDIDLSRARPKWEAQIFEDLTWLGLTWEEPVLRQSTRLPAYREALSALWSRGLLYPCTCRRRDIEAALSAPQEGVLIHGPDGPVYPGTCRPAQPIGGACPEDAVLRLNMARAVQGFDALSWDETGLAEQTGITAEALVETVGDVVLARRGMGTSYHLAVVVDDAYQGVTHVSRGVDLAEATVIHVLLQQLLSLPKPVYHHHRLIRDDSGKRLAKRDDARAIARYRSEGVTPFDIRRMVGL